MIQAWVFVRSEDNPNETKFILAADDTASLLRDVRKVWELLNVGREDGDRFRLTVGKLNCRNPRGERYGTIDADGNYFICLPDKLLQRTDSAEWIGQNRAA